MDFDPAKHPRDPHGEFTAVLRKARVGTSVMLPSGQRVDVRAGKSGGRTVRKFRVHPGSEDMGAAVANMRAGVFEGGPKQFSTADRAAEHALDISARSAHPQSLGGTERFANYRDYVRRTSVKAA